MEPRIQYAKTSDGVNIAFWTLGEGTPLVRLGLYPGAAASQMYSYLPEYRDFLDALSRRLKLIHIDFRGTGHSERALSEFSVESLVLDLESVVDRLRFDRFALYATSWSAPVSFAYAAKHPRRVSHLILWHAASRGPNLSTPLSRAVASMLEADWEAATETVAHFQWGLAPGQDAHLYAAALRESVTRETFQAQWEAASRFDATDLLPLVTVPTLLFHRHDSLMPTVGEARDLASQLPDGRLVLLERSSIATNETVPIIEEFLTEGTTPYPDGLTEREVEVLRLIAVGKSNREIADRLVISLNTVARHVSHIFAKTGVANRAEAATYANRHRLMPW